MGMSEPTTIGDEIRRRIVPVKLLPSGIDKIEASATKHSRPGRRRMARGDVLRACMVIAYRHEAELDQVLEQMQNGEV